jgi:DUF1009 family protein
MTKLGLIAGSGNFPLMLAKEAKKNGYAVYTVDLLNTKDPRLKLLSSETKHIKMGRLSTIINYFKSRNIEKVVAAGFVKHASVFDIIPDLRLAKVLTSIKDKKAESIFKAVTTEFAKDAIEFTDPTPLLEKHFAKEGVLTETKPNKQQKSDIKMGWFSAKKIAELDIGLTAVVAQGTVIAVEAMEGTDKCILRAGEIYKLAVSENKKPLGLTVVKVARPNQDMRFDLPVVGENTIKTMIKSGASVLAVEAGKTLFLESEKALELADQNKISVIGISHPAK